MVEKATFGIQFTSPAFGDLHSHTDFAYSGISLDGLESPERAVERAEEMGLSFLAITDHDTVIPSFRAKEHQIKQGYHVEVVTGAEVSSIDGHILGLNLQDNIPFWLSAEDTIRAIHRQGGYAVAAHPFYKMTSSVGERVLWRVAHNEDPEIYWNGIEVFNAGANDFRYFEKAKHLFTRDGNRAARRFYSEHGHTGLFGIPAAGSDTHKIGQGRALTVIDSSKTIYEALNTIEAGVSITNEADHYTFGDLRTISRKSKVLEQVRRQSPTQVFPSLKPSTY